MTDVDVLTDEESDALLEQSEDQDRAPVSGVQEPGDEFWEQVSVDRNPALETLNAGLADALVHVWELMFRRRIIVSPQPPRYTDGRRLVGSVEFEESIKSFDLRPLGEECLLIVKPETVSAMVDICFGGPGSGSRNERLAALTEMERRLYARFCDSVRDSLNELWRTNGDLALADSEQPFDGSMHSLCESGARVVACRFLFDIDQEQHCLEFAWPHGLIDALSRNTHKALPAAKSDSEEHWSERISEEVKGANIQLRAVIGGVSIRLHEISAAKTGDIIMTEQLSKVCLFAGSRPVFEGTLGSHEGFNAVKISQPYVQKRSGDI